MIRLARALYRPETDPAAHERACRLLAALAIGTATLAAAAAVLLALATGTAP